MSIFTKIGKAVKKGLKQVSIKNAVKFGTPFLSMIPLVGGQVQQTVEGISASAEAKKQARIAEQEGNQAKAQALHDQADALAIQAGANVGQQAGSVINAFSKGATKELVAQASDGLKEASGVAGASVVDSTIKEWFKLHWQLLVGVLVGVAALFFFWKKTSHPSKKRWNSTVNKRRYA